MSPIISLGNAITRSLVQRRLARQGDLQLALVQVLRQHIAANREGGGSEL
jgi:hypothetical protein